MPRGPRIAYENAFYHVFNRGIARQTIFKEPADYQRFLKKLQDLRTKKHFDHAIYAYVLMPSHFHILIQTKKTPLAKLMSSLLTSCAVCFNRKYNRVGPLFQNRFKSKLCDKDAYFLGASRYIHLNPIEARLTTKLSDYPWSSYQELFGSSPFSIVDINEVERLIGNTMQSRKQYQKFLQDGVEQISDIKDEYNFSTDIGGSVRFSTLAQRKYLRRRRKRAV